MRNWRTMLGLLAALSLLTAACGGETATPADVAEEGDAEDTDADEADEADETEDAEDDMDETEEADDSADGDAPGGDLTASGASFPVPIYQEWIGEYTQSVNTDASINYQSTGSSAGKEALISQQVDYAGTDSVFSDDELSDAADARDGAEVLHIPMVQGGVVVAYNFEGAEELILDGDTIAGIFLGEITDLNDDAIAELNPDSELPDQPLNVVHRADGSGTTSIFTTYLEDVSPAWAEQVGSGSEIEWPTGIGGDGNDGVAAGIQQQNGGIGYVNLEFAVESGLDYAQVVNADGQPVEATPESVAEAAETADIPEDLRFDILGVGGEGYPIAGTTWVTAYTAGYDEDTAALMQDWFRWCVEEGDDLAIELNYAPLADSLEEQTLAMIDRINEDG